MTERAGGTFTFVFSDIEGSTRLVRALGDDHAGLLRQQRDILESAAGAHRGRIFGSEGDALFLVFSDARSAILAAAEAQRGIDAASWPRELPVRLRMGVHTGAAQAVGADYVGLSLHETARITAAGHGGQILLSAATRELVRDTMPEGAELRDLGEHRLKDLAGPVRIFQLDLPGRPVAFPPLRTLEALGARLPAQLTSFVGRDDVERAAVLLERTRLLTLTGPGGTGKTRLSLQIAAEVAPRFPDGTWFVALDAIAEPDLVAPEIAATLGLGGGADPPLERVIKQLGERRVLLVLDNMEQVLAAGPAVARVVRECQATHVIATSRIPLRIAGEQEYPVPPLRVPAESDAQGAAEAARWEAVRLFVERAMATRPDFALTDANATAVADIVRRLDGLPLAIELAAARLRSLPIEALRSRLASRLSILTGGARDLPSRQQTLRGAIDWSHELLDRPDRWLFECFSVFAGGADLREVERVCGPAEEIGREVLDGLTSLIEQSLLRSVDPVSDEPRFAMLATIREYAQERLASSDGADIIHRRHAEAYLDLAEGFAALLTGPEGGAWNDRLEAEHDNLRAALDWSVAHDEAALAMRMVIALWRFWQVRGHLTEAEERIHRVLAMPSAGDQPPDVRSRAEAAAGSVAYWRSHVVNAHRHYGTALHLARETGEVRLIAESLYNLGFAPSETELRPVDRYGEGKPYFEQSLELYRELGEVPGVASALWALSISAAALRDLEAAELINRESLAIARDLGDPFRVAWASHMLGLTLLSVGRLDESESALHEAMQVFRAASDLGGVALLLADLALLALAQGDGERGWRLMGAADRLRETSGTDLVTDVWDFVAWSFPKAPANEREQKAFQAGRGLGTDEAIADALVTDSGDGGGAT